MDYPTFLAHIRRESARFRAVLGDCDPAARVPACPDWDAADLLWHLTGVQSFWAHVVRTRPAAPTEDLPRPTRPSSYDEMLAAFDEHSAALVRELEAAGPEAPAWHWSSVQTVGTSFRRQAHEALIHRLDAEQTAGTVTDLDPELAGDGVRELVEVMYGGDVPAWGRVEPGPTVVRIDLVDLDTSVLVRPSAFVGTDPDSGTVHDGPYLQAETDPSRPADAVVAGRAADLDAWLWRRRDDTAITVSGDPAAYRAFRDCVDHPLD